MSRKVEVWKGTPEIIDTEEQVIWLDKYSFDPWDNNAMQPSPYKLSNSIKVDVRELVYYKNDRMCRVSIAIADTDSQLYKALEGFSIAFDQLAESHSILRGRLIDKSAALGKLQMEHRKLQARWYVRLFSRFDRGSG